MNPSFTRKSRPTRPCQWFLQGNCKWGSQCRFSHESLSEPPASSARVDAENTSAIEAPTCGVCMESIHLYALLLSCDHPFCMPCIHKWRTDVPFNANEETMKSKRSCPLCRAHSDYVIPSPKFVVGAAKETLKKEFLKSKGNTPCRNWEKDGKCKFGGHCFYAHLDQDGNCCKEQQLEKESLRKARRGRWRRHYDSENADVDFDFLRFLLQIQGREQRRELRLEQLQMEGANEYEDDEWTGDEIEVDEDDEEYDYENELDDWDSDTDYESFY